MGFTYPATLRKLLKTAWVFCVQMQLYCLFRLPVLYFSRFNRIFTNFQPTVELIRDFVFDEEAQKGPQGWQSMTPEVRDRHRAQYHELKGAWQKLLDDLMKEWNTFNVVSALLVPAILTLFQIDGASDDPLTRFFAFWSLICALFSLLYGCSFISILSLMRPGHVIAQLAEEVRGYYRPLPWNFWVALSMPAIWLIWSIIAFIVCIASFVWRSHTNPPDHQDVFSISPATASIFRIFLCTLLGTGVLVGIAIIITFMFGNGLGRVAPHPSNQGGPAPTTSATRQPLSDNVTRLFIPQPPTDVSQRIMAAMAPNVTEIIMARPSTEIIMAQPSTDVSQQIMARGDVAPSQEIRNV